MKVTLAGVAVSVAGVASVAPVPESAILNAVLDALLVMDNVPVLAPAEPGVNRILNEVL